MIPSLEKNTLYRSDYVELIISQSRSTSISLLTFVKPVKKRELAPISSYLLLPSFPVGRNCIRVSRGFEREPVFCLVRTVLYFIVTVFHDFFRVPELC